MKTIFFFFLSIISIFILLSCSDNEGIIDKGVTKEHIIYPKYPQSNVIINAGSYFLENIDIQTKAVELTKDSIWTDDFVKSFFYNANNPMTLSDEHYFYPGSLFRGHYLMDASIDRIAAKIKPITVSVSLPVKKVSGRILSPSLSATRQFIADIMYQEGIGEQIGGLSYQIKRFETYDELKYAYESNKRVNALFFNSTSSTDKTIHKITKNTGIYIKFVQSNFTLDMDLPEDGYLINEELTSSEIGGYDPVYVKSIVYGRMGILTLESNYSYEQASKYVDEAFKVIFVGKGTNVSEETKTFLNNCDMKILLAGGDGEAAAKTVAGFDEFVEFMRVGGKFSPSTPGVPVSFKLAHLSDNTPANLSFQINVYLNPVFARVEYRNANTSKRIADFYLAFYKDSEGKISTVPGTDMEFEIDQYYYSYKNDHGLISNKLMEVMNYSYRPMINQREILIRKDCQYSNVGTTNGVLYESYLNHIIKPGPGFKRLVPLKPSNLLWP